MKQGDPRVGYVNITYISADKTHWPATLADYSNYLWPNVIVVVGRGTEKDLILFKKFSYTE